jgi:hypothetical protein
MGIQCDHLFTVVGAGGITGADRGRNLVRTFYLP